MPGSHADEIVRDYFDPDDWAEKLMDDTERSRIWICRRYPRLVLRPPDRRIESAFRYAEAMMIRIRSSAPGL